MTLEFPDLYKCDEKIRILTVEVERLKTSRDYWANEYNKLAQAIRPVFDVIQPVGLLENGIVTSVTDHGLYQVKTKESES
jgi:hypothetical protein